MRPDQANRLRTRTGRPGEDRLRTRWQMPFAEHPRYIQLETVTKCNARCEFCPQHEIARDPARMPRETWQKIVDDTRGQGVTYRPFPDQRALRRQAHARAGALHQGERPDGQGRVQYQRRNW